MLLSTGEQISCSLCAMAIEAMGYPVVSLTGWQAGFRTNSSYGDARIKRIDTERVLAELDKNTIVIVTGFQGLNKYEDITTLGRGGSDTSAVALAAVLHADLCQIYTDVDGVYTADPRPRPRRPQAGWRSPSTRCWSWPLWGPRCSTTARSRWQNATMSIWRSSPVSPESRGPRVKEVVKIMEKSACQRSRKAIKMWPVWLVVGPGRRAWHRLPDLLPAGPGEDQRGHHPSVHRPGGQEGHQLHSEHQDAERRGSHPYFGGKPGYTSASTTSTSTTKSPRSPSWGRA